MWPEPGSGKMLTSGLFVYEVAKLHPATIENEISPDILQTIDDIQKTWGRGEKISLTRLDEALEQADSKEELVYVIRKLVSANLKLQEMSSKDPLTNLDNRRALEEKLPAIMNRLKRQEPPGKLAVFMIDADHFKKINDTFGHPMGDFALKTIAGIIKENVRSYDIVARYGGEEFMVVAEANEKNAMNMAELLRTEIERSLKYEMKGHYENEKQRKLVDKMAGTVSIGLSFYDASKKEDITSEKLIDQADIALYEAKKTRNTCSVYSPKIKKPETKMAEPESVDEKLRRILQKPEIEKTLKGLENRPVVKPKKKTA